MAIQDLFKGDSGKGLAIGLGAAILAPVVLPLVASAAKPVARALIKTGIIMYEKGREAMAECGEVFDDLVAEARAEIEQNHAAKAAVAATAVVQGATAPAPAEAESTGAPTQG